MLISFRTEHQRRSASETTQVTRTVGANLSWHIVRLQKIWPNFHHTGTRNFFSSLHSLRSASDWTWTSRIEVSDWNPSCLESTRFGWTGRVKIPQEDSYMRPRHPANLTFFQKIFKQEVLPKRTRWSLPLSRRYVTASCPPLRKHMVIRSKRQEFSIELVWWIKGKCVCVCVCVCVLNPNRSTWSVCVCVYWTQIDLHECVCVCVCSHARMHVLRHPLVSDTFKTWLTVWGLISASCFKLNGGNRSILSKVMGKNVFGVFFYKFVAVPAFFPCVIV